MIYITCAIIGFQLSGGRSRTIGRALEQSFVITFETFILKMCINCSAGTLMTEAVILFYNFSFVASWSFTL